MGFFSKLQNFINPKKSIEDRIKFDNELYYTLKEQFPDTDPHHILAFVFISNYELSLDNETHKTLAYSETMMCSCLKDGDNIRALSLYCIDREEPKLLKKCPEYHQEFYFLMMPVDMSNQIYGNFLNLYKLHNPNMEDELKLNEIDSDNLKQTFSL